MENGDLHRSDSVKRRRMYVKKFTKQGGPPLDEFLDPDVRIRLVEDGQRVRPETEPGPVFFLYADPEGHVDSDRVSIVTLARWLWRTDPRRE